MDAALVLKTASIVFAVAGGLWSLRAARMPLADGPDPDRVRRRHYVGSYVLTSISMLMLAGIGLL